jgi:hypothetical protein
MPRPAGGSMGHAKHRKKGTPQKNGRFKQAKMREANAPPEFVRRAEPMVSSVKELFKGKVG